MAPRELTVQFASAFRQARTARFCERARRVLRHGYQPTFNCIPERAGQFQRLSLSRRLGDIASASREVCASGTTDFYAMIRCPLTPSQKGASAGARSVDIIELSAGRDSRGILREWKNPSPLKRMRHVDGWPFILPFPAAAHAFHHSHISHKGPCRVIAKELFKVDVHPTMGFD